MWGGEDVRMWGCEDQKMRRWENVKMWGCEDEKTWGFEDVMWRCENVKMFDRPPLLEEPFAQTLSGKMNGIENGMSPYLSRVFPITFQTRQNHMLVFPLFCQDCWGKRWYPLQRNVTQNAAKSGSAGNGQVDRISLDGWIMLNIHMHIYMLTESKHLYRYI